MENQDNNKNKNELEELKQKCDEYLNGWKRERADFLNYKKDETERLGNMVNYASRTMVLKMLPVLDNVQLAEKGIPEELKQSEWFKGFIQIQAQVRDFLKREGIEEIKTVGQPFNPEYMEAIEEEDGEASGIVTEELQKGYTMDGKLIRPAKVRVAK